MNKMKEVELETNEPFKIKVVKDGVIIADFCMSLDCLIHDSLGKQRAVFDITDYILLENAVLGKFKIRG